ncbi:MAG: hypothetical protein ABIH66_11070 [bacterium]
MAKRPPIGWILLAGAASAAGAALTAYVVKRRRGASESAASGENPDKDAAPGITTISCAKCGADVKEYEFFCPACGEPMDTIRSE